MNKLVHLVDTLESVLDTSRKRHVVGGILMSTSLLFAGLAITIISMKVNREEGAE